jgi:hypothetical protein
MTEPEGELLRSYFESDRFQASPDLEGRVLRALSARPRVRARFVLPSAPIPARLVAALGALVVLALGVAVPVAAAPSGLAVIPRQVLGEVGAAPVVERLMPIQASATSSGYTMSLVSAYADDARTILVLRIRPTLRGAILDQSYVVDSTGHRMDLRDEFPNDNGYYVASFEPMRSHRSARAKLTLYTPRLAVGPGLGQATVYGSWILQFTVTPQGGRTLPIPAPGQAGTMNVTFGSVHAVPGALAISVTTRGAAVGSWWAACPYVRGGGQLDINGCAVDVVSVYDANGNSMRLLGGFEGDAQVVNGTVVPTVVHWTGMFEAPQPGQYRVVISAPDRRTLERIVRVP